MFVYVSLLMILILPIALAAMLFYLIGFRKPMKFIINKLAQLWALSIVKITGVKATVTGKENIPRSGGVCFVSNHCGYFDIILLLAFCTRQFGFIAKKELAFVPFLNCWIFMLGGLFIDRKNIRKGIKTIRKGAQRISTGGGMIIFPEGTRSKGQGLLSFRPGSLKLATMAKAPIVPVAIEGSYDVFEKTKRFVRTPVKLAFLKPIDTKDMPREDQKNILCDKIYLAIKEELDIDKKSICTQLDRFLLIL